MSTQDRWLRDRDEGFDKIAAASGRFRNQMSRALFDGAHNLLDKAIIALEQDDPERAARFISRAASMPWDDNEESFPGFVATSVLLYTELTDALEDGDPGDEEWLDTALEVLEHAEGIGRDVLASMLNGFDLHEGTYELTARERRRIHAAVGSAPLDLLYDVSPDTPVDERIAMITSVMTTTLAYHRSYFHGPDEHAP